MIKVLGTGLSGLVGSRVVELLTSRYSFENLSLETGVDITDAKSVKDFFDKSDAPWVFHFAAYTDVQGAEKERALGEKSIAWKINVAATQSIIDNAIKHSKKVLYIDTDYAFDGKKSEYSEDDPPHPLGWYARTKFEGAKRVLGLGSQGLVIRISNPYRAHPTGQSLQPGKKDFVHKMLERLQSGQGITAPKDQLFVPTFIDDIAYAVDALIIHNAHGMYHIVGSGPLSPFDAATTLAKEFGCDTALVKSIPFAEMFRDRAPTPQYAALKNDKIASLGVLMRTFKDGIKEIKRQEE